MKVTGFKKAVSLFAVASVFTMAGCQKEDMMQEQFSAQNNDAAMEDITNGRAIQGQYIVTLKSNESTDLRIGSPSERFKKVKGLANDLTSKYNLPESAVEHIYESAMTGFAIKASAGQIEALRQDERVASVEQDKIIALGKGGKKGGDATTTTGGGKGRGGKKNTTTTTTTTTSTSTGTTSTSTGTTSGTTTTTTTTPTTTTTNTSGSYTAITAMAGETIPWGVARVGYGDGSGKTVWVIDSGVDTDHPDLTVDVSRSKSFVSGVSSVEDGYGHGTQVSGIIAAKNNGSGVIGVAAGATIVALRVFDNAGAGSMSAAIAAVNHVIVNAKAGDVVNMSLGGGYSPTLDNAVLTAAGKGILFAVAAGNSAMDCSTASPARVNAPNVFTVSAMDSYARMWSSSNYGAPVDYAAPGVGIKTTNKSAGYASYVNGTSYAAPHVAGILALKGNHVASTGVITGDKDSNADKIASL